MSKIAIFGLIAIVILLVGASVVFAQDATTTPGAALVCPVTGTTPPGASGDGTATPGQGMMGSGNLEQMQQMHDSMGQNVPEGMQQMHDAMGQAMQSGDIQQMQDTCQSYRNGQQGDVSETPAPENPPASSNTNARRGGMMSSV